MLVVQKLKTLFISILIMGFVAACGGGGSSSDSGGQGRPGCTNPNLDFSYLFTANGNSNDSFTARFRNNNTVSADINGGQNGSWAYVGSPPSQIRFNLGADTITANIATNERCDVVTITLTAPDGVAFTGTRR